MAWLDWLGIRAVTVDGSANLLVGSPDTSSIIYPTYRPIMSDRGAWLAYDRPDSNETLYAYNANARFNELAGNTVFNRDVWVLGTLHVPGFPVALGRGPTNGGLYSNRGFTMWSPNGAGRVNIAWASPVNPVIVVTAEEGQPVPITCVATVASSTSASILTASGGNARDMVISVVVYEG